MVGLNVIADVGIFSDDGHNVIADVRIFSDDGQNAITDVGIFSDGRSKCHSLDHVDRNIL